MDWENLAISAGIVADGRFTEINVRKVAATGEAGIDLIICNTQDTDARIADRAGRAPRELPAARLYMARAFSRDAVTASAVLVRAIIGRWLVMRGARSAHDEHEVAALRAIDAHLAQAGFDAQPIGASGNQVSPNHISAPIKHTCPEEVVRKAISQFAKQIGGRTLLVFCPGP